MIRTSKGKIIAADYLDYKEAYKIALELIAEQKRIGLLIMFGINCGLRYSDLIKLTDADIQKARANNNELILTEQKTKKRRCVYLNESVLNAYEKYPQIGNLFQSQKKSLYDISYINKQLKKLFKTDKKRNVSTHSLRKTFARTSYNLAQDKEHELIKLSELLNHSSTQMTRLYLGITKEEINDIYNNIQNALLI